MRITLWSCLLLVLPLTAFGQNLLNGPEQIVWDSVYQRYLAASYYAAAVVQIDEYGNQSYFAEGISAPLAACIVDSLLLVTGHRPHKVYGFSLATGDIVLEIPFPVTDPGMAGIAADTAGNVYLSHQNGGLYTLDLQSQTYGYLTGILGVGTPQGTIYVPEDHALWVVGWRTGSRIFKWDIAASLASYSPPTAGENLDLARDSYGNTYIASWATDCVHKMDSTGNFSQWSCGHARPTGLCVRFDLDLMLISNFTSDRIDYKHLFIGIDADTVWGWDSLVVNFAGSSRVSVDDWLWLFGDGDSAFVQSPAHTYRQPGLYDVTLSTSSASRAPAENTYTRHGYVAVLADSLSGDRLLELYHDSLVEVTVRATNNMYLYRLQIPVEYAGELPLQLIDFTTAGCRTEHFDDVSYAHLDTGNHAATLKLEGGHLAPGEGPVVILTFAVRGAMAGTTDIGLDGYPGYLPTFYANYADYQPVIADGQVHLFCCIGDRGNVDNLVGPGGEVDVADLTFLVAYLFQSGPAPPCTDEGNVDGLAGPAGPIDVADLTYLVTYLFQSGPAPAACP